MSDEPRNQETQSLGADSGPAEVMRRYAAMQAKEARPERIGPYRILETLGEGAWAWFTSPNRPNPSIAAWR